MGNTKKKRPKWTTGEIIIGKPVKFLVLTGIFTVFLLSQADTIVTKIVRGSGIDENSIGDSFFIILIASIIILSVFLSVAILKLIANLRLSAMTPAEAERAHSIQARFKWNIGFSLIVGYIALYLMLSCIYSPIVMPLINADNLLLSFVLTLASLIAIYMCPVLVVKAVNKTMIRLTGTNKVVIEELLAGKHKKEIPDKYYNQEDFNGIVATLETAQASTVKGAVFLYTCKKVIKKICKSLFIVGAVIGAILTILTLCSMAEGGGATRSGPAPRRRTWYDDQWWWYDDYDY